MVENLYVFDFTLTKEEMERIDALKKNRCYNDPGDGCGKAPGAFCPIHNFKGKGEENEYRFCFRATVSRQRPELWLPSSDLTAKSNSSPSEILLS
jgi:hypothetical protein